MTDATPEHKPTTTALTFTQPRTPHERYVFAQSLAEARQLPGQIRGSQADVLLRIEYGVAVGIPPVSALTAIHLIDGKPTASAGMISGLLRTAGKLRLWTEQDPKEADGIKRAVATYRRHDDPDFEYRVEWTVERAIAAKLLRRDGDRLLAVKPGSAWDTYRDGMLKARATSEIGRDAAEDVLLGIHYTPEELGATVNESGDVIEGEVVGSTTFVNYATPPAAEPATPVVDVTAERLEEVRSLILAAWQDGSLEDLTAVFRGPVKEYDLAATLEVVTLEEVDGKPTGEVVTLEELFRRVGTAIRNGVPAPEEPGTGDDGGSGEQEGPSGGSAAPTGPAAPPADGGGAADVIDGEIVEEPPGWGPTVEAPEGGSPLDLPTDATVLDVMTPAQVAAALGGTVLTAEEAEAHAAAVGERLRDYGRELGRTGFDRGTEDQRRAYETGPAAARAALEASRRARAGA